MRKLALILSILSLLTCCFGQSNIGLFMGSGQQVKREAGLKYSTPTYQIGVSTCFYVKDSVNWYFQNFVIVQSDRRKIFESVNGIYKEFKLAESKSRRHQLNFSPGTGVVISEGASLFTEFMLNYEHEKYKEGLKLSLGNLIEYSDIFNKGTFTNHFYFRFTIMPKVF